MTDLTELDRAILAAEGCLVDAEAAARAWCRNASGSDERWTEYAAWQREGMCADAAAALRAAGLTPGEPALHLILAAIERRGWSVDWLSDPARGNDAHCAGILRPGCDDLAVGEAADAATAFALAFVAAVRATKEDHDG